MTEYSKASLEVMLERMEEIRRLYDRYSELEAEVNSYINPGTERFSEAPSIEMKRFWRECERTLIDVSDLINREIKAYTVRRDKLEEEALIREKLSRSVDPNVMPFSESDRIVEAI